MAAVLGLGIIIGCICALVIPSAAADDNSTFVSVAEIYNHPEHVQQLYNALAGNGATYEQIKTLAGKTQNAADFRAVNNNQDIKVTFGGQEWHAVYLSQTNETNPRPILTLLLNGYKLGVYAHYVTSQTSYPYPNNQYSTSLVRTELLNAGGTHIIDTAGKVGTTAQNVNHQYADFTLPSGKYTKVIVQPKNVAWQGSTSNQNQPNVSYRYTNNLDTKYNNDLYGAWQNDYLWLPSVTEVITYWQMLPQQFNCMYIWSRGASNENKFGVDTLNTYTITANSDGTDPFFEHGYQHGIVPALHIDLSALELHAHDYVATPTDPTCVKDGYTTHTCQYCNDQYVDTPTPATGVHSYDADGWKEITKATCTNDGVELQNCTDCGRAETRAIPALGHDWGDWTLKEATCTTSGERSHQCDRCGETETEIIPATGHQYGEWVTNTDGTKEEHTCEICGTTETRSLVLPTTGGDNSSTVWLIFGIIAGGVLVLGGGAVSWLFIAGRQRKKQVATA